MKAFAQIIVKKYVATFKCPWKVMYHVLPEGKHTTNIFTHVH